LPPEARFDRRSGIRNWSDSYYDIGPDQYVFVPTRQFGEERIEGVIVPEQRNIAIINQTTNVTNISYNNTIIVNEGPSYEELRTQTQTPIRRLRLERQTNAQVNDPRAVVRGDVVEVPAPVIAPVRPSERPRIVKETIAQATVDLGWAAISNQREAEQARAKIKSEATPPRDAPSKKFVRAAETNPAAVMTATATPTPTAASPPPAAKASTPIPQSTFTPRAIASPITAPAASPTSPPESTEAARATPTASPAATSPSTRGAIGEPQPTATPINTATPDSSSPARERGKLKSVGQEFEKQRTAPIRSPAVNPRAVENATPLPTPSTIPTSSIAPEAIATPTPSSSGATETSPASRGGTSGALPDRERKRNLSTFTPGLTPGASAAGSIAPAEGGGDNEGKRDKRARGKQSVASPSISPSPAPEQ
jgi:hypothetical protein